MKSSLRKIEIKVYLLTWKIWVDSDQKKEVQHAELRFTPEARQREKQFSSLSAVIMQRVQPCSHRFRSFLCTQHVDTTEIDVTQRMLYKNQFNVYFILLHMHMHLNLGSYYPLLHYADRIQRSHLIHVQNYNFPLQVAISIHHCSYWQRALTHGQMTTSWRSKAAEPKSSWWTKWFK